MKLTVRINNLDRVIEDVKDDLTEGAEKGLKEVGAFVWSEAVKQCPVHYGDLRRSITFDSNEQEATIFTNREYAPYVEYGTGLFAKNEDGRKTPWSWFDASGDYTKDGKPGWITTRGQRPQPYMNPAVDENIDEIMEILKENIGGSNND